MGAWAVFVTQTLCFISGLLQSVLLDRHHRRRDDVDRAESLQSNRAFSLSVTEPVFEWIREHLPVVFGGIDFSPLVVIFGIQIIQQVLLPTLRQALRQAAVCLMPDAASSMAPDRLRFRDDRDSRAARIAASRDCCALKRAAW